ncbi:hypothetical protein Taro_045941, partial [Colocasia esculenta]|nr:hypothetical protein [Colocasia esculenta]
DQKIKLRIAEEREEEGAKMALLPLFTLLLLLSCFLLCLSLTVDRLNPGESLAINRTLVSDGGTFALGFFTLGASPPRRYLGVWYNNLPGNRTVVWVANREIPFTETSDVVLRLSDYSDLVVTDSAQNVLWSANTTSSTSGGGPAGFLLLTVVLQSTGNVVLQAGNGNIFWQSFDYGGNTGLPSMTLWFDTATSRSNRLLSWKSATDPSPGDFTMGIDPATVQQVILWRNNQTYWRYNPWDGVLYNASYFFIQDSTNEGLSITFTSSNSPLQRVHLDHDGILRILYWSNSSMRWVSLWSNTDSTNACEAYTACGPFGFCNNTGSGRPTCNCLPGHEPRVLSEWNRGNHSAGCARPAVGSERCDQNDVFGSVGAMKLPDKMVYLKQVTSVRDCEGACRSNCSCTAYAHANATNINVTTARCFVWHGDLMDLVQYRASSPGESLHFRLSYSPHSGLGGNHFCFKDGGLMQIEGTCSHRFTNFIANDPPNSDIFYITIYRRPRMRDLDPQIPPNAIGVEHIDAGFDVSNNLWLSNMANLQFRFLEVYGLSYRRGRVIRFIIMPIIGVVLAAILICLAWRYKKTLRGRKGQQMGHHAFISSVTSTKPGKEAGDEDVQSLSFECITAATSNFSDSNKLGEGGFGKVYKGIMSTGEEVAIKRLSKGSSQGQEEFKNEVSLIAKLQHRNLVKLLDSTKQAQLDWEKRFHIIKGIARGLMYLHEDSRFKIVHRDLKASNILLDEDMSPKISDFGIARTFGGNESRCFTNKVVGTYGYMSPEYAMEGHFSVKSDVYSFGVVLLEILSGRRNIIFYHNQVLLNLLNYAWHMWKEDNPMNFLDSSIASTSSPAQVSRCLHVGLLCVQDHANKRPFMSNVVFMLENDTPIQDSPKRPMFMLEAGQDGSEIPRSGSACPSVNDLSITAIQGR